MNAYYKYYTFCVVVVSYFDDDGIGIVIVYNRIKANAHTQVTAASATTSLISNTLCC